MLQWFPLDGVPHGEVHLKLQWFSLKDDPNLPTEVTLPARTHLLVFPPVLRFLSKLKLCLPASVHRRPGFSHAGCVPGQRLKPAGETLPVVVVVVVVVVRYADVLDPLVVFANRKTTARSASTTSTGRPRKAG